MQILSSMKNKHKRFFYSIFFPLFFLIIIWLIKIFEQVYNYPLHRYGIYPLRFENLTGIIFSPLLHGDFDHLISNSLPFFVLASALFYFYKKFSFRIFWLIYFISGCWVWLAAVPGAYHIGASGLIYGLASFLVFSGLMHKNKSLTAVSFLVIFIYGSMVWGVLPMKKGISWESHLFGSITGLILSIWFSRKQIIDKTPEKIKTNTEDFSDIDITDENYIDIQYFYEE